MMRSGGKMKDEWSLKDKITPDKLHGSYLEAIQKINPESFNPNAQKHYDDLTSDQQFIDIYICTEINKVFDTLRQRLIKDLYNIDFKYRPLNSEKDGKMNWDVIVENLTHIINKRFGIKK